MSNSIVRRIKENILIVCKKCPKFKRCTSRVGLACKLAGGEVKPTFRGVNS